MATKEPISNRGKAEYFNQTLPLKSYFKPLIGDKKKVRILDIGSGPYPTTGQLLDGVEVEIIYADNHDPANFWDHVEPSPKFPIEYQDMEKLTYQDNSFDIVNCINALDHTINALDGVKEMQRVVKPGGWVHIVCALDQRSQQGMRHYWDAKADGRFVGATDEFNLKDYGFSVAFVDDLEDRNYEYMVAKYKKPLKEQAA